MSGKRVDIITTWAEAALALGVNWRTLKTMHQDYLDTEHPMPIEVRGRRVTTTVAALQEWADKKAELAGTRKKSEA